MYIHIVSSRSQSLGSDLDVEGICILIDYCNREKNLPSSPQFIQLVSTQLSNSSFIQQLWGNYFLSFLAPSLSSLSPFCLRINTVSGSLSSSLTMCRVLFFLSFLLFCLPLYMHTFLLTQKHLLQNATLLTH